MEVYSPAEVAQQLKIKPATLRKYSIMLEEQGYKINRNSQNHRYYTDKDVMTIRRIITSKNSDVTLEEVIHNIVSIHEHNTYTNDTNNDVITHDIVTSDVTNKDIEELKEMILLQSKQIDLQSEIIANLSNKIDVHQKYIEEQQVELLENKEVERNKRSFFKWLFHR